MSMKCILIKIKIKFNIDINIWKHKKQIKIVDCHW